MKYAELMKRIEEHEDAELHRMAAALRVWSAFLEAEPDLAREVLKLFPTDEEAALWFVAPYMTPGQTPARVVAEGRAAEVMARVLRTGHGFVG